jgi:hypothetical protein
MKVHLVCRRTAHRAGCRCRTGPSRTAGWGDRSRNGGKARGESFQQGVRSCSGADPTPPRGRKRRCWRSSRSRRAGSGRRIRPGIVCNTFFISSRSRFFGVAFIRMPVASLRMVQQFFRIKRTMRKESRGSSQYQGLKTRINPLSSTRTDVSMSPTMWRKAPRTLRLCFESRWSSQAESPFPRMPTPARYDHDLTDHGLRVSEPLEGFIEDEGRCSHKKGDVDHGSKNFGTL